MTTTTRLLRALVATLAVAIGTVAGATPVLANGLGDLYVAVPEGVVEVRLVTEEIVDTVGEAGATTGLAFTNDGAFLFVLDERGAVGRINIESISLDRTYTLPSAAAAIAHPKGDTLVVALKGTNQLAVLADGDTDPSAGLRLHGEADLLAADRLDHRLIAARAGESWVDVVDPPSGTIHKATVQGEVVALAVADDSGFGYVATTAPNRLARVALATGKVDWDAALHGRPAAVTAIDGAAVVAIGGELVRVKGTTAASWASPGAGAITSLATNDEGLFVYAATAKQVIAIDRERPTAEPRATVRVADAAVLAPVNKTSSLTANGGQTTDPEDGTGASPGSGEGRVRPSRAPATDTEGDGGPRWRRPGPDPLLVGGVGAGIVVLVLVGSREAIRRSLGER